MRYANERKKFWKHAFRVWLASISEPICINADHAQDALDFAVDYAEQKGWEGYFVDPDDDGYLEFPDDYITAGNHGRILPAEEVFIKQLVKGEWK